MISKNTIDQINDLELEQVISKYVKLKKSGANYQGLSPFVEEKTPSFIVSPAKGIWKCFSSGKGGGSAIKFVMDLVTNGDFPDAISDIAGKFNIEIEYDDSESAIKHQELAHKKNTLLDINAFALEIFKQNSIDSCNVDFRASNEAIDKFSIGFSNKDYKDLYNKALKNGISERLLYEAGLITKSSKGTYDFFNSRIIFPIFNYSGKLTGFGGRVLDNSKPKYINTKDTDLFSKSKSLYGIHLAKNSIRHKNKVNVVEGYYDVIAMYENGIENTVAPCGTSFTIDQAKILIKWCDTFRLLMDGDKAGINSMRKSIEMLLPLGAKIEVCILPSTTTKNSVIYHDPDSILKEEEFKDDIITNGFDSFIERYTIDGIEWLVDFFFESADTTIKKSQAQVKTEKLLALIPESRLRNTYAKVISKNQKISKSEIEKNINIEISSASKIIDDGSPRLFLPHGAKEEEYEKYGFVETYNPKADNVGYWFPKSANNKIIFEKVSNFLIQPIIHIYSKTDNKRLIKIKNKSKERIIDVPSKGFVGFTQFQEAIIDEGFFFFSGTKIHFQKVMMKILEKFPTCEEIKTLGWQSEGFYCFANGIAENTFKRIDPNGLVGFSDKKYFLPAFSDIYKNVREEDDLYENDRSFKYSPSNILFLEWSNLFVRVHGDNGKVAIAFFIATLFRDYIYNIYKVFPHLFLFGGISTGKSYCARSINSIFFGGQPGFNLTSGTNVGFFRKLARVRNAVSWFDEYENDIDRVRFQALKAAYDGLGHEKGVMSRDNRTESTKVNSSSLISGQYIPTRDDNSLLSRSILCTFSRKKEELTQEDEIKGSELKELEQKGLSNLIIDVVKYRDYVENNFKKTFFEVNESVKNRIKEADFSGRLLLNYSIILTSTKLLMDKVNIAFTYDDIESVCSEMLIQQSEQITNSDAIATFWSVVEHLYQTYKITMDDDFKVEETNNLTIQYDRDTRDTINYKFPKKLLFIRFRMIHNKYLEDHRKLYGENGLASNSILAYFKSNKAFIGNTPSTRFKNGKTSAYVFDYNMLGIQLEGSLSVPENKEVKQKLPF